jgi:hypothetical protein
MPTNLKKLVRVRMDKTRESYATALRYVRARRSKATAAAAAASGPSSAVRRMRYRNAVRRDPAIDAYVSSERGALGDILSQTVDLIRATVPAHDEIVRHGAPQFCVEGEPFCYLVGFTRHVNLGFCEGAAFKDPDGLLEGTGKQMRHVKLSPSRAIAPAKLARLLRQSAARIRDRQARDPKAKA